MQSYISQIIWCKRSRETKYEAGRCRETNSYFPSEPVWNSSGEQHGDEHPKVVNGANQSPLPFLTAEVELKDEVDLEIAQMS